MKGGYDVESYAEAFDAHNDFTGAIHPDGLAAEFRGICEDADAEIAGLRRALVSHQIEAGTHLFHRMRGVEINSRLLDNLEQRTDSREECYRLSAALTAAGIPAQARLDDKGPPLRITVERAREIMGMVEERPPKKQEG